MKKETISLLALPLLIASCSSSKMVPEGEYILNKVEVKSDSAGYNAGALKQYVRQKEKPKLFSLFKNPFSKKPVIYDTLQARLSCQDLLTAMQNQGFMHAGVSLYATKKGKKLDATYLLHPGEPFVIGKVKYEVEDEHIQQLLHLDNPDNQQIKPGMRFTVETLDNERRRISSLLTNDGYFRFHKDFIQFSADTIAGQKDIALTLHLMKYKANSNAPEVDHPRYEIRNINYLSNDSDRIHLRHQVLLNATALREGRPYSAAALQRTYNNFARLQAVKYTNISFSEVPDSNQVTENGMERDSISRQMDCNIQISTNKPSTIAFQPEGTNTAGDLGAAASLTYTNRNLFRGSEQLSIELRGAYEAITGLEGYQDQNYTEYSVEGKLVFPRFVAPFLSRNFRRRQTANSELSASWNLQNRPEFHRRVLTSAWRYYWKGLRGLSYRFDLIDINFVHMPWISSTFKSNYLDDTTYRNAILKYNYEDLFILKSGVSISYNSKNQAFRTNLEVGGNVLNAISHLTKAKKNFDGQYTLFKIAYAQYVKGDFDYTRLLQLDVKNQLALHFGLGIAYPYSNSNILPFEKRYFSGGANSVRGWNVRELGPGKFRGSDGKIDFINQTGDMKFDMNVELRTALFWKFNGAFFIDAGNIWTLKNYKDQPGGQFKFDTFLKQLAVAYGLGLRVNFDYFIVRLDCGMKAVNPAYTTSTEHYPIANPILGRDLSVHFAVGMPF